MRAQHKRGRVNSKIALSTSRYLLVSLLSLFTRVSVQVTQIPEVQAITRCIGFGYSKEQK